MLELPKGHNPAREVPSLKIPRAEPIVWTPETLQKCLKWYQDSGSPDVGGKIVFLSLGAFAGMRPSEIEGVVGERDGLRWEDIDFEQRHIRIRPEVAGKLAESRYITFTEKPGSGLTKEVADTIWATLCSWVEPLVRLSFLHRSLDWVHQLSPPPPTADQHPGRRSRLPSAALRQDRAPGAGDLADPDRSPHGPLLGGHWLFTNASVFGRPQVRKRSTGNAASRDIDCSSMARRTHLSRWKE